MHASLLAAKTAPRLLQDLLTHDPRNVASRNILTTAPPPFDPSGPGVRAVPAKNCRHDLAVKDEQSKLPNRDFDDGDLFKIACYCQKCRWHVDIFVDLCDDGPKKMPCQLYNPQYPLHHFVFDDDTLDGRYPLIMGDPARKYRFHCSAPRCPVQLSICMRPPFLKDEWINLLTNTQLLKSRWLTANELNEGRPEGQMARPVDGLDFLGTYLADSLNPQQGKTRIPLLNRKFLKTFGRDCDDMLRALGFTEHIEEHQDGPGTEVWYLPTPPPAGDPLDVPSLRTIIEDSRHELVAHLIGFPYEQRQNLRRPVIPPTPAKQAIERLLGCEGYPKHATRLRSSSASEEDHPHYAGLGALGDFSDDLLIFAFRSQRRVDEPNSPYYFECLQGIAIGRNSNHLETQVQIFASQGYTNRSEVEQAYRFIGVDPSHAHHITDDHIIGQFRSRLSDISPSAVQDTRNALKIIGFARKSKRLEEEASNVIETYSQALSWLDLTEDQPDDFVITMYTLKVGESQANEEIGKKAIQIIADHRNSQKLRDWLLTGHVGNTTEMDVSEAYALLGINDRANQIDLETLRAQVEVFGSDTPENKDKYEQAYAMICKDQQENYNQFQSTFVTPRKTHPLATWPVGCRNNGNTCYLNSVLQFLFTIKPLRDMILNCEKYLEDASPESLKSKRVGRSEVVLEKVERAQQFVHELRGLFKDMIYANSDCIRPEMKLAALALARTNSANPDELTNDEGQINSNSAPLGDIGGMPVAGPVPNPKTAPQEPMEIRITGADEIMQDADAPLSSSSSTVVEADPDEDVLVDVLMDMGSSVDKIEENKSSPPEPPSRPPPVPPRPLDIKKIEGLAQQQDAAEILNNVFDLLSCAIRAEGTMPDGEQIDLIKKLFFSEVTTVLSTNGEVTRNPALKDHHLISPGRRERPLYAALDDEFSLTELEGVNQFKYELISQASPIQIINVRRLLFEGGKATKDESHLILDDVLYLDRYLNRTRSLAEDALQQLRDKQWQLQRQLSVLDGRKTELRITDVKMTVPDVLEETANFLESLDKAAEEKLVDVEENVVSAEPHLADSLRRRSSEIRLEIESLDGEMKQLDEQINAVFKDCRDHPYRLHSVFMHSGSAKGGHYWIYIFDTQNQIWRKYNDEYVDEVDPKEIFEQQGKATSTSVVYVQEDRVNELTEAVLRKPDTDAANGDNAIEMKEVNNDFVDVPVINGVEVD